jgi:hypothetical protein
MDHNPLVGGRARAVLDHWDEFPTLDPATATPLRNRAMLTPAKRLALLNAAILAVRPHGMLAETVLEPLQTLRDDLAADKPVKASRAKKPKNGDFDPEDGSLDEPDDDADAPEEAG